MIQNQVIEKWADAFCKKHDMDRHYVSDKTLIQEYEVRIELNKKMKGLGFDADEI